MRIENKYIRNRRFRSKYWKRIRSKTNPFEYTNGVWFYTTEEQVKRHFDEIDIHARFIENGTHKHWYNAPKWFRKQLWQERKAQEKHSMSKIRQGDYEVEIPSFKRDANWLWF